MIDWLLVAPAVLLVTALVLLPGLALGLALRLRGALLWGFAPAGGTAVIGVAALMLAVIGVRWSPGTAASCAIVLIALAGLVSRLATSVRLPQRRMRVGRGVWVAIAVGALIGAIRMAVVIGHPQNISQTNDATFHLSVLRYIEASGSASSLDVLGALNTTGFYPAAWHAIASLLMDIAGADGILASNALSLALAGPLWTMSITVFVWSVTGGRRVATIAAALMAPALYAFPFYMLDFGVLYPYALALALLPGAVAVLVIALRSTRGEATRPVWRLWLTVGIVSLVAVAALGLAQPSALLVWLIAAMSLLIGDILRRWPDADRSQRRRLAGLALMLLLGALAIWLAITFISSDLLWEPRKPLLPAAMDLLLNDAVGPGPAVTMSVLSLIGFVACVRAPRLRGMALYSTAIALVTLAAVSVQNDMIRALLAAWYADWHRFLALMPLVVIPLAAIGVDRIAARIRRRRRWAGRAAVAVLLALVVLETSGWTLASHHNGTHRYGTSTDSYLSVGEQTLLESLPEYVPADSRILGNPSAGAAFGYALSGLDVVPRTWSKPGGEDFELLRQNLVDLTQDASVCPAVERMGIDYVLDFGESDEGPGKWDMPGLTGFAHAEGFQKVASDGGASLWRIIGCG